MIIIQDWMCKLQLLYRSQREKSSSETVLKATMVTPAPNTEEFQRGW